MKYEFIDNITSDVMFKAYGKTLEELVENSAEALFSVVCDIKKVKPEKSLIIEIESDDEKDLIRDWLSKLLTTVDIENMFFSEFKVLELKRDRKLSMKVECFGEKIRSDLILTIAKAVTYYRYSVEKTDKGWVANVVLDI